MKRTSLLLLCLGMSSFASTQAAYVGPPGAMSATVSGNDLVIESTGGLLTYTAVIDRKQGNVKQLSLRPACRSCTT